MLAAEKMQRTQQCQSVQEFGVFGESREQECLCLCNKFPLRPSLDPACDFTTGFPC